MPAPEAAQLQELRALLGAQAKNGLDEDGRPDSDPTLLRFIRARKGDMPGALKHGEPGRNVVVYDVNGGWKRYSAALESQQEKQKDRLQKAESAAQSLAWLAIMLYPVGVVVLSAWLLYLGRQTLLLEGESTPYTRSIAFLHAYAA